LIFENFRIKHKNILFGLAGFAIFGGGTFFISFNYQFPETLT